MAYSFRMAYSSSAAGETHTATVYSDDGTALGSQPAYNIRDLGAGAYLYVTAAMPAGHGGCVIIKNGGTLVTGGVVSPEETEGAAAIWDLANGIETGLTPRKALRLLAAVLGGELSGGGTTLETIRNAVADSKDRVIAIVDSQGNRTGITYDLD